MRQKGFAPILIIFLVLIAIGGAYYFGTKRGNVFPTPTQTPTSITTSTPTQITPTVKPTADPTANWKTYANSSYSYQIKYPSDWSVIREDKDKPAFKTIVQLTPNNSTNNLPSVVVVIEQNTFDTVYNGLKEISERYKGTFKQFTVNNLITNANKAEFITGAGDSDYNIQVIFEKNKLAYNIEFLSNNPPDPNEIKLFDQILSTFKFTQ